MTLKDIERILKCEVLVKAGKMDMEISVGCGADLMSDVLTFCTPGSVLLTGLTNAQSIRTADIADVAAVVYVRGKRPDADALTLAEEKKIPILVTDLLMYDACGLLYEEGLRGNGDKVERLKVCDG